jgi:hypothetical protein
VGSASFSTGQVVVTGGTIAVTNSAASGVFSVPSGGVIMSGGGLISDQLWITNSAGQFTLNGGTVSTKGTTVANGAPFVVGDGTAAATLHFDGGVHQFANGLVISSNATLSGCGTIIGSIINHGTIATNCGPAAVDVTFRGRIGMTNFVSFPSQVGATYILEYKDSLVSTSWTDILPGTNGTGNVIMLGDTTASGPARYYRVRTQ